MTDSAGQSVALQVNKISTSMTLTTSCLVEVKVCNVSFTLVNDSLSVDNTFYFSQYQKMEVLPTVRRGLPLVVKWSIQFKTVTSASNYPW